MDTFVHDASPRTVPRRRSHTRSHPLPPETVERALPKCRKAYLLARPPPTPGLLAGGADSAAEPTVTQRSARELETAMRLREPVPAQAYMSRRSAFATNHLAPLVITVQAGESKYSRDQIHRRHVSTLLDEQRFIPAGMRTMLPAPRTKVDMPWHPSAFREVFAVDPTF